jgi:hypothetical protein
MRSVLGEISMCIVIRKALGPAATKAWCRCEWAMQMSSFIWRTISSLKDHIRNSGLNHSGLTECDDTRTGSNRLDSISNMHV